MPNVILLQETMGEGKRDIEGLCRLSKDWHFMSLDAEGNSRGLLTGWNKTIT